MLPKQFICFNLVAYTDANEAVSSIRLSAPMPQELFESEYRETWWYDPKEKEKVLEIRAFVKDQWDRPLQMVRDGKPRTFGFTVIADGAGEDKPHNVYVSEFEGEEPLESDCLAELEIPIGGHLRIECPDGKWLKATPAAHEGFKQSCFLIDFSICSMKPQKEIEFVI